ncbi:hypothetical protein BGZ98_000890 [Dissophora globulifera]|nr:hypothetical protein BGZ98_000890 [Dissophora globulifera]
MATVKNRFDDLPADPSQQDGRWLSTYSRGLCSIYPKDEDHCWDYLLSTQSLAIAEKETPPTSTTPFVDGGATNSNSNNNNSSNNSNKGDDVLLGPLSPGVLSHALCKIGFDCIDYFTATQDDIAPELPRPSSTPNTYGRSYKSPMLEDLSESDWRTGLAAAVCGKRTAALERKRVLSRSMSQVDVVTPSAIASTNGPWFETLDRLARWDEVAYR